MDNQIRRNDPLKTFSDILLLIGGLNWGLTGLGRLIADQNWNVINVALGSVPQLEWFIYLLVGIAAVYSIYAWNRDAAHYGRTAHIH
ncbi:MAG: DUF378 domain-containing protein [Candidatus Gracilibacteria bacterium]